MLGEKIKDLPDILPMEGASVKVPTFSWLKITGLDTVLGPEMKSTGEVMGLDSNYESATTKALIASNMMLPDSGSILLSIADQDKENAIPLINVLHKNSYKIFATQGTAKLINSLGIPVIEINKRLEDGHPNVVDIIQNSTVDAVVNTVTGDRSVLQDGFHIRRAAVEMRIPCLSLIHI